MCNLYTVRKSRDEVAAFFRARKPAVEVNLPDDILPGTPGLVVREADGGRVLQSMVWGFPMRFASMKPGSKPKPVNNIADIAKFTWKALAQKPASRCLIPLTSFAEPEGREGCEDEDLGHGEGPADRRLGGAVARQRRMGSRLFRGDDGLQRRDASAARPHAGAAAAGRVRRVAARDHSTNSIALQKRRFPNELIEISPTQELWVPKKPAAPAEKATLRVT